jgi:phenylalanyl-tRNA synthetase beta chain
LCGEETNYTKIKQMLDNLLKSLNLTAVVEEAVQPSFIKGRCGKIFVEKKEVAVIGEIAPDVLNNFSLIMPVVAFELNLTQLFEIVDKQQNTE